MLLTRKFLAGSTLFALIFLPWQIGAAEPDQMADHLRTETDLFALEKVWNDAHLQGDADALERLWDDQFVVIVPKMKIISKSEALSVLRSGRVKFLRYETSDLTLRIFGDTALLMGHLSRTRKFNDREMADEWHFTKLYVRRFGVWQVVLWQTSDWPAASAGSEKPASDQ